MIGAVEDLIGAQNTIPTVNQSINHREEEEMIAAITHGIQQGGNVVRDTTRSVLTWNWTKRLLHWIIISAGTMSECVFLIASLWVSINANVHQFVLLFIDENTTKHMTELATTAYVALPECIVGLAVVVTLSHIRMIMYNRSDFRSWIWSILYGLPTIVFMVLSLVTLGNAVNNINFQMPGYLVVTRALAGYMFAFTSLLYTQLGVPQERDRLMKKDELTARLREKKDEIITELTAEKARLNAIIENQKAEMENLKQLLDARKNTETELLNALNKSNEIALQAYSEECQNWLKSGVKTASVADINAYTGHSKRKIEGAITKGNLQVSPRNKDLILVSSLVEWLKMNPVSSLKMVGESA